MEGGQEEIQVQLQELWDENLAKIGREMLLECCSLSLLRGERFEETGMEEIPEEDLEVSRKEWIYLPLPD